MKKQFKEINKLYELLDLALDDLVVINDKKNKYELSMNIWHSPEDNGKCSVCLAGAVMANRLKADRKKYKKPENFDYEEHDRLLAIDALRQGEIGYAMELLDIDKREDAYEIFDWYTASEYEYFDSFQTSLMYYRDMAEALYEADL